MNKIFFKRSIVGALLAGVLVFTAVPAQAAFLDDIQSQLLDLANRISNLKKSQQNFQQGAGSASAREMEMPLIAPPAFGGGGSKPVPQPGDFDNGEQEPSWCHTFNTNLRFEDSGKEVEALQAALAKDGSKHWEYKGFDGIFDEATASEVVGFQQKYASEILAPFGLRYGTGFVGKGTRAKLNSLYGCQDEAQNQINYDAAPVSDIHLGQTYKFSAKVKDAPSNSTVYLYLQRPDGSFEYNGVSGYLLGSTDAFGNWDRSITQTLENRGQTGTYVSWVMIGGVPSNKIYHHVVGAGISPRPTITVLSPNGGEVLQVGSPYLIRWDSIGDISNVSIGISENTGQKDWFIAGLVGIGDNLYKWDGKKVNDTTGKIVIDTPTGSYYLFVCGGFDSRGNLLNKICDWSNNTFNIVSPSASQPFLGDVTGDKKVDIGDALLIAQYVAGKRTLTAAQLKQADVNQDGQVSTNDTKLIAIYAVGADNVKSLPVYLKVGDVNLDKNVSAADTLLITQYAAGTRTLTQFQLAAADVNNDDKVTQADAQTIADFLAGKMQKLPFPAAPLGGGTITLPVQPYIAVVSPNGGETWEIGKTYDITWNAQGVDSAVLMLEDDNTSGQRTAWTIGVVPAVQGKYSWTVPQVRSGSVKPGTRFKIALNGATVRDISNSYFSIAQPPTVTPPPITSVGDVNSDKKVDIGDALFIAQYVAGKRTLTQAQLKQADVNQDGQVSTNDSKIIAMYTVGADNVKSLPITLKVGDTNLDGNVSAADTLFITQYVAGTRTLTQTQLAAADVNNDDKVTQADVQTIADFLAGKVQKLPFPAAPLSVEQKLILTPAPGFVLPSMSGLPIQNVVIAKYVLSADAQGPVTLNQVFIDLAKGTDAFDSSDVKNLYATSADGALITNKISNPSQYSNSYAIDYDGELQPGQSLEILVHADILASAADADTLPDTMAIDMSVTAVAPPFKAIGTGKVQGQTLAVSLPTIENPEEAWIYFYHNPDDLISLRDGEEREFVWGAQNNRIRVSGITADSANFTFNNGQSFTLNVGERYKLNYGDAELMLSGISLLERTIQIRLTIPKASGRYGFVQGTLGTIKGQSHRFLFLEAAYQTTVRDASCSSIKLEVNGTEIPSLPKGVESKMGDGTLVGLDTMKCSE